MDIFRKARREVSSDAPARDDTRVTGAATPPAQDAGPVDGAEEKNGPPVAADDPDARWVGYIDFMDRSVITGWCYDAHHPERSVPIEVITSAGKRRVVVAGLFRQDVKDAGYGGGHHGFTVDVAPLLVKDETFIVRFAESKVAITSGPVSLEPQRALLDGRLPQSYTSAMQVLALEAQAFHAEQEERLRIGGVVA